MSLPPKNIVTRFTEFDGSEKDDAIIEKILAFWNACKSSATNAPVANKTWAGFLKRYQGEFISKLDGHENADLKKMLAISGRRTLPKAMRKGQEDTPFSASFRTRTTRGEHSGGRKSCFPWRRRSARSPVKPQP